MTAFALLLFAATGGLTPIGLGHAASGTRVDLVVRTPPAPAAGRPVALRVLLSDAATDAPVDAPIRLRFYGPLGAQPVEVATVPGALPGYGLATASFPRAGRWALAALARGEWLADNGFDLAAPAPPAGRGRFSRRAGLAAAALLLLLALLALRRRPAVAVALLALALPGGAVAHQMLEPKAAAIPGARVYVPQEIQFALGIRTAPAMVRSFAPPPGSDEAPRQFLAVPENARVDREGRKLVFVRTAPEWFVAREPKLGWEDGGFVAVVNGVAPDEKVVVAGAAFLRNGGAAQ